MKKALRLYITVRSISNDTWSADDSHNPKVFSHGQSADEAIGNLLQAHAEHFGLAFDIEHDNNPYEHNSSYSGCHEDCQACEWEEEHA